MFKTMGRLLLLVLIVLAIVLLWRAFGPGDPEGRDRFTDRPVLLACGRTPVAPGDTAGRAVIELGKEANECFDAAVAEGTGAEVVVESASAEGEPVFEYHRALPEGGVEVFVDSKGGGFGPPSLTWFRCPDARTFVVARQDCEFREL